MSVENKLKELIQKVAKGKIDESEIVPQADLREDLGLDSVAQMELLVLSEEAFGVKIDSEAAAQTTTVGMMIDYVNRYAKG